MYVWIRARRQGATFANPYTGMPAQRRGESGAHASESVASYERDVLADYRAAFGEEPAADLPASGS